MNIPLFFSRIGKLFSRCSKPSNPSNLLHADERQPAVLLAHNQQPTVTLTNTMKELAASHNKLPKDFVPSDADASVLRDVASFTTQMMNLRENAVVLPPPEPAVVLPTPAAPLGFPAPPRSPRDAAPVPVAPASAQQQAPAQPTPIEQVPLPLSFLFTGRFKVGKDHTAKSMNAEIFSFAEPLYALQYHFFGLLDKNLPGAREFLQTCGAWARGHITEAYPITAARAGFVEMIRRLGAEGAFPESLKMDWKAFGSNENVLVESCGQRVNAFQQSQKTEGCTPEVDVAKRRVANTTVRFQNELSYFQSRGWIHWHVMCSGPTWAARLKAAGLDTNERAKKDITEEMAVALDHKVTTIISRDPRGRMLRVIWNDENVPAPSPRMFTIDSFLQHIAILESSWKV